MYKVSLYKNVILYIQMKGKNITMKKLIVISSVITAIVGITIFFLLNETNKNAQATAQDKTVKRTLSDKELQSYFQTLGPIPVPKNNPQTDVKIELGKMLFVDERLSGNNKMSCLSCHTSYLGYTDNLTKSLGTNDVMLSRNTPTIINSAYSTSQFWDGRAKTLEEQAVGPITSEKEMNQNIEQLEQEIQNIPGYKPYFDEAFDGEITIDTITKAIAAYQRTVIVDNTKFDQYIAGDNEALSEQEKWGMELFVGKGACITCHAGSNFTDNNFHNVGVNSGDNGLASITNKPEDTGKFKTPTLRGIVHTSPYLHDGSEVTLRDVIDFYNRGGNGDPNTSPLIKPLGLTLAEKEALVAFMRAISGTPPTLEIPTLPK